MLADSWTCVLLITEAIVVPGGIRVPLIPRPVSSFWVAPLLQPARPVLQKCAVAELTMSEVTELTAPPVDTNPEPESTVTPVRDVPVVPV